MWEKIKTWAKNVWNESWARAWGYTKLLVALGGACLHYLGGIVNDGNVKAAVDALHLDPKILLGLAVLGAVTILSAPKE